ncbi:hypothetical protein QP162_08790 [Sphingomonas aurantiaca]|uniref:hypothetical protein n=1 Tax=Sphingomonas aurantiaca TaxID=185949 RepID=UPI002FE22C4B
MPMIIDEPASRLNKLITERLPGSDKGGPDPVLDRLFAELISANGTPASATTLLLRLNAQPGLKNRGHYQLLLATARKRAASSPTPSGCTSR